LWPYSNFNDQRLVYKDEYYIDPNIKQGLKSWQSVKSSEEIYKSYKFLKRNFMISLSDAWTVYSWSKWLRGRDEIPESVILIHLDDHRDDMSPHLFQNENKYYNSLNKKEFDLTHPVSVHDAISTGAIGMGSIIIPLLLFIPIVEIRHIRLENSRYASELARYLVSVEFDHNCIINPNGKRPHFRLLEKSTEGNHRYILTDLENVLEGTSDMPVLLHIDYDYFNNRFDGDSNWFDQSFSDTTDSNVIISRIEQTLSVLESLNGKYENISMSISPGFYPSEYWAFTTEMIFERLKDKVLTSNIAE
jgi:hypothetical protein